ncbi:MAG: glycosyltransferase family 9 protein [Ignavibacteriaceae bacterium]|nr:glycosyltransferase family 9 protein [Ignavibacteriaceae bacterium]
MEKILVIQTAFIGDAILTLPMIQKLKDILPDSLIDVLAIPSTAEIFSSSPKVDNTIVLDKRGKQKSVRGLLKFIKELKKNNYSRIYSPHRSFRSSFIVMMLGVKETYGFTKSSFKYVYRHLIKYVPAHHEVQRNLDLIGFEYKDDWKILPEIHIPDTAEKKINEFISANKLSGNIAAIAPGSVWNTKKYPETYFIDIIRYFREKRYSVILIGSEKDKNLCDNIAGSFTDGVISSAGNFSIVETICLLKTAKIIVSNDSAPTHFGMCANIPVLTIYCSTVPEFGFSPYNLKSTFVSLDGLDCKPCGIHGHDKCPIKTFICGANLKPQIVISKIEEMINDIV